MTAEELPIYPYFSLEDFRWEDVKDLPGADEDYLCDWEQMVCRVVEGHFRQACRNLWPLIEGKEFKSISIGLDVIGMEKGMAGFYHDFSKEEEGKYGFSLSYNVLSEYLSHHLDSKFVFNQHTQYMWEHELIHLCDHSNLTEFRFNLRSTDVREFLVHYLLSFRNEGIADLYFMMKGHNNVKDPETARQKFHEGIKNFASDQWEAESIIKQKEWEVMQTYDFYSVGPWMILHVLCCGGYEGMTPLAEDAAQKIRAGEVMAEDEMLELIRRAVKITNGDFVDLLVRPGLDGIPFLEKTLINNLASRIGKIRHKRVIHEEDEEYSRVNVMLVDFFETHWGYET